MCRANQNTHAKFNNIFPKIVPWKNTVQPDRPQKTIWRMDISWSISKATNTNSEFEILIALPLQQRLHERAWMLRYTYIAYVVYYVSKPTFFFPPEEISSATTVRNKQIRTGNPRQRWCRYTTTMFMPDSLYRPSIRKREKTGTNYRCALKRTPVKRGMGLYPNFGISLLSPGWTNPGHQVARATKLSILAPDICGHWEGTCFVSPVWRLEFWWRLPDSWKNCPPLWYSKFEALTTFLISN